MTKNKVGDCLEKFVIIDGNSVLNRAFYALPMLANFEGVVSNAVFGFTNIITKVINEMKPKYMCVAFDFARKTFRNDIYENYKGTRKPTPPELKSQMPIMKEVLSAMNIKIIEQQNIEADDIIGTLTKMFNVENIIVTGDKDSFQLINDNTKVCFTKKGVSETIVYDKNTLFKDYGISPSQVVELKALMGDASDNIPGVAGVGEKTAVTLLTEYGTLDNVYKNIDLIKGKLNEKLVTDKQMAYISKQLATIKTDVDLYVKLSDFTYDYPFKENVLNLFKKYQFNSLIKRTDLFEENIESLVDFEAHNKVLQKVEKLSDLEPVLTEAKKHKKLYICIEETINLYVDSDEYEVNFNTDLLSVGLDIFEVIDKLKPVLQDQGIEKYVYDYKSMLHKLNKYNVTLNNVKFDILLARYLINSNAKSNAKLKEIIEENMLDNTFLAYSVSVIYKAYFAKLEELGLIDLFYDMELPLSKVLFDMEISGFKIDQNELNELDKKYSLRLEELTKQIYQVAGVEFNINSPKQLAEVLFDKLNLVAWNNKKNSTNIDVLTEIYDKHEVVPLLVEYRKITKLYTTYVKAFMGLVDQKTSKIHTVFNQTNTATGRLSSVEPNLQNIPVRTEEGKSLRKMFVPSFDNGYILSADYSQIELRLLASFSKDEKLIKAFNEGKDIHALTASEIFGVSLSEVTEGMRRDAKAINFGIIYGISDYGLSQNINSTRVKAAEYIKNYFEKYPKVKEYMDNNIKFCRENGYVKTYFGRIRFILEINSSNYNLRQFGERAAMNMPLQGTASDIIKLAMVKIANELKDKKLESKLILQIHDELIIDCKKEELQEVKAVLISCMENVVDLPVKLNVNAEHGINWFET